MIDRGGGPVWYVDQGTTVALAMGELVGLAQTRDSSITDAVWAITPFVEMPSDTPPGPFRWEREWRHIGDLAFDETDPVFLFIPEELHAGARTFFDDARVQNTGPCYDCAFLDPRWDRQRILATLTSGQDNAGRA